MVGSDWGAGQLLPAGPDKDRVLPRLAFASLGCATKASLLCSPTGSSNLHARPPQLASSPSFSPQSARHAQPSQAPSHPPSPHPPAPSPRPLSSEPPCPCCPAPPRAPPRTTTLIYPAACSIVRPPRLECSVWCAPSARALTVSTRAPSPPPRRRGCWRRTAKSPYASAKTDTKWTLTF